MILGKDNLDDLLRAWPAPEPGAAQVGASSSVADSAGGREKDVINSEGGGHWEEWAEVIVKAATSAGPATDPAALDALLGAPALHEPGEPGSLITVSVSAGTGEIKMSQENEPGVTPSAEPSAPSTSVAPVASTSAPERKRSSLKAFAEKASVRPSMSPVSVPSATTTPLPTSVGTLPAGRLSRPGPAPVSRPTEAGADDSGMVNLNLVKESATPQQIASAEQAKPGTADLFEDEKPTVAEAKAEGAKVIPITAAKAAEPKKSNNGAIAGIAIALIGVAAAFGIMKMQSKPEATPVVSEAKPTVADPKPAPTATEAVAAPTAVAAVEATAAPVATADPALGDPAKVAALPTGGPLPSGAAVAAKDPAAEKAAALALAEKAKNAPAGKPGDLQSEMAKAVGATDAPSGARDGTPEPAAANPKLANVPEQPSQGSVQGAIGTVMGGAKACVAGADDVSRAQVTFSSAGTVSNVAVTGWAAAHGKSGCVSSALKAAKVGPFSKPSFTVGVTIRP